jgi:hypothetical protein
MSRKKGTPEGFRGVAEGCAKFTPPLGEEHSLFATKEFTVGFTEAGEDEGLCVRVKWSCLWRILHSSSNQRFMGQEPGVGLWVC